MKKYIPHALFLLLVAGVAFGGAIKTWATGEVLRAADLNSNFAHIHNTMVGGHGARLVDSDVSASAAISHSKLATPMLVPRAMGTVETAGGNSCTASPCAVIESTGITSVTRSGAGVYSVTIPARADADFVVLITPARSQDRVCSFVSNTTSNFGVNCFDTAGAAADARFNIVLFDAE